MSETQSFTSEEIGVLVACALLLISTVCAVTFHVMGWHQKMERIIWGREFASLGLMGNSMKMAQWISYCVFSFAARRDQVESEIAKVPRRLKICIHCFFWSGIAWFTVTILATPPSVWWNGGN